MDQAWQQSTGKGQVVAVIDSGVDASHPDLRGSVLPGHDFVDGSTDGRRDDVGHGTMVASLIAGHKDDRGVVGLAPDSRILPIRVLDDHNEYDSADQVASAVRWATDHGADVINLSLGSAQTATVLSNALHYAADHDVVVVACTGNLSNRRGTNVWHPAREPGVVAVSGVTKQGEFWRGSLSGSATVLSAPATEIVGAHPGGDYQQMQGTSFAAPMVSAAAALVRSKLPELSAGNVIQRLITTAWDYGPPGRDPEFGFGIVNPTRALTASVPTVSGNPLLRGTGAQDVGASPQQHSTASPQRPGTPGPVSQARKHSSEGLSAAQVILLANVIVTVFVAGACIGVLLMRRRTTPTEK
jgi:type VII secretion-associated serine protease mycosin